jgi:hypothetical protein
MVMNENLAEIIKLVKEAKGMVKAYRLTPGLSPEEIGEVDLVLMRLAEAKCSLEVLQ